MLHCSDCKFYEVYVTKDNKLEFFCDRRGEVMNYKLTHEDECCKFFVEPEYKRGNILTARY
jgi:hypothetical protein